MFIYEGTNNLVSGAFLSVSVYIPSIICKWICVALPTLRIVQTGNLHVLFDENFIQQF